MSGDKEKFKKSRNNKKREKKSATTGSGEIDTKKNPLKKTFKIVVRKLPLDNYDTDTFQQDIVKLNEKLHLPSDTLHFEHFLQGKLRYY